MRPIVVFDCDGTLVDSAAMIVAAMEQAFVDAAIEPPAAAAIREIIGLSLDEAIRRLAPAATPLGGRRIVQHYRSAFMALRADGGYDELLFPGIAALLAELDRDGRVMAIATGKSRNGVAHLLAKHGLEDVFVSVQTADTNPSKPHPAMLLNAVAEAGGEPGDAVMIGDTSYDMEMAVAAGVAAVGVGWGHHPADHLRATGAAHVAADAGELRALLCP